MRSHPVRSVASLSLVLLLAGCPPEDGTDATDSTAAGMGGTVDTAHAAPGGGIEASSADPCQTYWGMHGPHIIYGTDGPDILRGSDQRDIIFGLGGDDQIWGNAGNDVICAGGGDDVVEGGMDDDYIDGGFGNDTLNGGAGKDCIHGRSGGDTIHGDAGDDVLFGDLLDDNLYGDDDDDILIGGHGTDYMHGGTGNDWLRGDTNGDTLIGGDGNADVASFMTATPPGQSLGMMPAVDGVNVGNLMIGDGHAGGDGEPEPMQGVETIVGSAFADHLIAGSDARNVYAGYGNDVVDAPSDTIVQGHGSDVCNGAPCGDGFAPAAGSVLVFLDAHPKDVGLGVIGTDMDDVLDIYLTHGIAHVRSDGATPLEAGDGCTVSSDGKLASCVMPAELRYVMAYGAGGNDTLTLSGDFPRDFTSTIDGGEGNDTLTGQDGQDILFAGHTGNDTMLGKNGDDALISESQDADTMNAGSGNDQLVTNWPCAGHTYIGGDGMDVGGFARVGNFDTAAERARQSIHAHIGFHAFQPTFCMESQGTTLANDIEILEGAGGDDILYGNDNDNIIWGREGDDTIYGLGGDDVLDGLADDDTLYGGPGRDQLRGGPGYDYLHADDGQADAVLDCGDGGGHVAGRDMSDPMGDMCN